MNYVSTRGDKERLDSAEAIIRGLAGDGGLFVPEDVPKVSLDFIEGLKPLSYEERAEKILGLFLADYTPEEIKDCVERAYGGGKFDDERRAPLRVLEDLSVLELWHGPTSAFKDMALQLLPQLLSTALKKRGESSEILILVATSGDTGKAALEGFRDVEQTKILVFYPEGGVSKIQRLQMVTQQGGNVAVVAVKGNFDDAQNGVKAIFGDSAFKKSLLEKKVKLSSANSINWGRLVPQIVYYFSAYADLLSHGKISLGEEVDFSVPTGNFGDILAAYYGKLMGLPVHKLICASNANNVLTDFLRTGVYDRNREFFKTITPSMDILISSNLERLLCHVTGDPAKVKGWMEELGKTGRYDVGAEVLAKIQELFWADWADDARTKEAIRRAKKEKDYVPDPHTAVAWAVAEAYQKEVERDHAMVVVSTASPYKFNASVLSALRGDLGSMDEFAMLDALKEECGANIPKGLDALRKAEVLHTKVCGKADMKGVVDAFAGGNRK